MEGQKEEKPLKPVLLMASCDRLHLCECVCVSVCVCARRFSSRSMGKGGTHTLRSYGLSSQEVQSVQHAPGLLEAAFRAGNSTDLKLVYDLEKKRSRLLLSAGHPLNRDTV